jgi:hypothetical protein
MSELCRAAAKGAMAHYTPPENWTGLWGQHIGPDYYDSRRIADMFNALAAVYEKYEEQES